MNFLQAPPRSASTEYCWLLAIDGRQLGVHLRDGWCMKLNEQMVYFDEEAKCVHLLPVLEQECASFAGQLQLAERTYPAFASSIRSLPKKMLFRHVFDTSVSGYWPEKALAWLADDTALQASLRQELEAFTQNKNMPQHLRQRAKGMLRKVPEKVRLPATT